MRSLIDAMSFGSGGKKFNSGRGDTTYTITHGAVTYVVDAQGNVITPAGTPLDYAHSDVMVGNQSGVTGKVRDFLTVDPSMDSPGSKIW
jgi:hypothetical protein